MARSPLCIVYQSARCLTISRLPPLSTPASGRRILAVVDDFHAPLAFVRGLRAGGYEPVAAVARGPGYVTYSRAVAAAVAVADPEEAPDTFAADVVHVAKQLKPAVILPATESSLLSLAHRRESLPVPLAAPATETVELATDKVRVLELAAECGLATPPSSLGTPSALAARADTFAYPVILKPGRSRFELGDGRLAHFTARRIDAADRLRETLAALPGGNWVVQPALPGKLCAVGGVAWEGRLIAAVHQVSHRIWPPRTGFSSYAETVPRDAQLESGLERLLAAIGWSGIFQAQMIAAPDGSRPLIDFNPRAYGSLALAVRAGANLPAIWARLVSGETPAPCRYRVGVRYRVEASDLRATIAMAAEGRLREALMALSPHPRTVHAVFSVRDPRPALVTAQRLYRRVQR